MQNADTALDNFLAERSRYSISKDKKHFKINAHEDYLKWSDTLIRKLKSEEPLQRDEKREIQVAMYRPFCRTHLYFDPLLIDRPAHQQRLFPTDDAENSVIAATCPGPDKPFMAMASKNMPDLHLVGPGAGAQCFPFYIYDEDG